MNSDNNIPKANPKANPKTFYRNNFRKRYYKPFKQWSQHYPLKRAKSNDNLNPNTSTSTSVNNNPNTNANANANANANSIDIEALINSIKGFIDTKFTEASNKLRNSINAQVENRCKYYIDQRIGLMLNSDDLLTRGTNSITISPDAVHGAKAFYFNYMHEPVAYITYDGRLYCKGLFLNGVNIMQAISKIMDDETSAASIYVKHSDLKNSTYSMDIDDIITKTATSTDVNSTYANITNSIATPWIKYLEHMDFYNDEDMRIDFKKMIMTYNDRGRLIYNTSGTYNNVLSLDVNKSHKIMARVYSDGSGLGNQDYFTTLKHEVTLLDGDGKTTLKNLVITDSVDLSLQYIQQIYAALTSGQQTTFKFGQGTNIYASGNLAYYMDSTLANSYIHLYLSGYSGLKIYADKCESVTPLYVPTLYVNNSLVDAANIAYTNVANTFTQPQNITGTGGKALNIYNNAGDNYICIGKSNTSRNRAVFGYRYAGSDGSNNSYGLLYFDNDVAKFYYNKFEVLKPLNIVATGNNNYNETLRIKDANLTSGHAVAMYFGKSFDNTNCMELDYYYNDTVNGRRIRLGFFSVNTSNLDIYPDHANFTRYLIAPLYETTNNTAATAIGTNLQNAIKELIQNNADNNVHQTIPASPYDTYSNTDNPYLSFKNYKLGDYGVPTEAITYSTELNQFVILATGGNVYYSYDGINWKQNSCSSRNWCSVTYGTTHGYIAITSDTNYVLKSTDGRSWTEYSTLPITNATAICYGNGYYVVVGKNTGNVYYTTNPTASSWNTISIMSANWFNIAYSAKQHYFCAVGYTGYYYRFNDNFTNDGKYGTCLPDTTNDCYGICYSDTLDLWCAVVNNFNYSYTSTDAKTWTKNAMPATKYYYNVKYGAGRFIAICNASKDAAYSVDGYHWKPMLTAGYASYDFWKGLEYGNGVFVACSYNTSETGCNKIAVYTPPGSFITPQAMFTAIYPVGSIYVSMNKINPGNMFGGYWSNISNYFLRCISTSSIDSPGATGGSNSHTHPLGDNGYALIATHAAGNICVKERGTPSWTPTHRMNTGGYTTAPSYDQYGQCLAGTTESTTTLPPYMNVYAWYRYA